MSHGQQQSQAGVDADFMESPVGMGSHFPAVHIKWQSLVRDGPAGPVWKTTPNENPGHMWWPSVPLQRPGW